MTVEFQSNVDESSGDVFVFLLCNLSLNTLCYKYLQI